MIQTSYDIIKAHGGTITVNSFNSPQGGPPGGSINVISNYHEPGELKVETPSSGLSVRNVVKAEATARAGTEAVGSTFTINLPI